MSFELQHVTWQGPEISDEGLLDELPDVLTKVLKWLNGWIQFRGAFHFRGACATPRWHSLREVWSGKRALHRTYARVMPSDIPFAQDYLGNQFLLRAGNVLKLSGETGLLEPPLADLVMISDGVDFTPSVLPFEAFLMFFQEKPEALGIDFLEEFLSNGGSLEPGELMHLYPPLCSREAENGVSPKPMKVEERLAFLAKVAKKVGKVRPGEEISFPLIR